MAKKMGRIEWGFELEAQVEIDVPSSDAPSEEWEIYHSASAERYEELTTMIHARGLCCAGSIGGSLNLLAVPYDKPAATDADREAVAAWFKSKPWTISFRIGPLFDVNESLATGFNSETIEFCRDASSIKEVQT